MKQPQKTKDQVKDQVIEAIETMEVMFTIILGTESWHIYPHPTTKSSKMIIEILEDIIKELKSDCKLFRKINKKSIKKKQRVKT